MVVFSFNVTDSMTMSRLRGRLRHFLVMITQFVETRRTVKSEKTERLVWCPSVSLGAGAG